jgi:rod shape-determining protein MreD
MTELTLVRRVLAVPVALLLALLLQVILVNRAPLPGGAAPDLVLLVVAALGATMGPMTGLLAGFCGGLALDIAPPGSHLAGEFALVCCLVGYACGRVRNAVDQSESRASVVSLAVVAAGVAAGEAARAALGMMLSDPDVTGPVVKHVLPTAILYDLLLCPFVLWLVAAAVRRSAPARVTDPHRMRPRAAAQYGALRLATAGAAPKLRFGGAPVAARPAPARKEPRLRLAGANSSSFSRTNGGTWKPHAPLARQRPVSVNFSGSRGGLIGGGLPGGALGPSLYGRAPARLKGPGKGWLRTGKPGKSATPAVRRSAPGKGWLRVGKPATASFRRSAPGKGWLRVGKPAAAASFRRSAPGKGWLRAGKPARVNMRRSSPSKGWLSSGRPATPNFRRSSPSRGWMGSGRHATPKGSGRPATPKWRRKSAGSSWLGGSRHRRLGGRR